MDTSGIEPDADAGPFLAVAVICERALQEIDGTISIIRIVDRMSVALAPLPGTGLLPPADMPSVALDLTLVVMIKTFSFGTHSVNVVTEAPTGNRVPVGEAAQLTVLPGASGANLIARVQFQSQHEGLYWFDVFVNDVRVTRIPLMVVYQALTALPGQSGTESE
jgi:hypothetical protein